MNCLFEIRSCLFAGETIRHAPVGQERIDQHIKHLEIFLKKMKDVDFKGHNVDFLFTDNTVSEYDQLPDPIKKTLEINNIETFLIDDNKVRNKGAGLMKIWLNLRERIDKYDYFLYFQPRIELVDSSFFQLFFDAPRNLMVHEKNDHIKTGYFCTEPKHLLTILDENKQYIRRKKFYIERSFYNYFIDRDDTEILYDKSYGVKYFGSKSKRY